MARQIGKMLNAREPKIVNGPEILNKFVGASEENIRKLFADAEKEVSLLVGNMACGCLKLWRGLVQGQGRGERPAYRHLRRTRRYLQATWFDKQWNRCW